MNTLTVIQIVAAHGAIARLRDKPLPGAVSYRLSKIAKYLDEEFRLYATVKNELIVRHGEPVPDKPDEYRVLPHLPGFAAYIEAMTRVHEETVPFPFRKIEVKDLDIDFSANEIEALAPISLIADGTTRASTLTTFMADANQEAQGDYRNGALEFIHFTDRFRDNPAVYDVIQSGIRFNWTHENAERLASGDAAQPGQIEQELTSAYNEHSWFGLGGQDPNEGRALDALMAANMAGGPARMREAVLASGADVVTLLNNFPEGSVERRLYSDLISQVPEFKAQLDAATTCS